MHVRSAPEGVKPSYSGLRSDWHLASCLEAVSMIQVSDAFQAGNHVS